MDRLLEKKPQSQRQIYQVYNGLEPATAIYYKILPNGAGRTSGTDCWKEVSKSETNITAILLVITSYNHFLPAEIIA